MCSCLAFSCPMDKMPPRGSIAADMAATLRCHPAFPSDLPLFGWCLGSSGKTDRSSPPRSRCWHQTVPTSCDVRVCTDCQEKLHGTFSELLLYKHVGPVNITCTPACNEHVCEIHHVLLHLLCVCAWYCRSLLFGCGVPPQRNAPVPGEPKRTKPCRS